VAPTETHSYYDERAETMPREDLERLQEARLMRLIPYVYERSAVVRHVWQQAGVMPADIRSMADFREKVPFIDKNTLQRFRDDHGDAACGLCCVGSPHLRGIGFTSGTTGDATAMPRGNETVTDQFIVRDYWQMGARPGDFMSLAMFTYRKGQHADRFAAMGLAPICFEHHPRDLPRLFQASLEYRPRILHMLSTPLALGIEQLVRESDIDPSDLFSSYSGASFGGEPMSPRLKAMFDAWGLEIYEYSTTGDAIHAMECSAHDGMHAWEDAALVEYLDPSGQEPMAEGQRAELAVTSLADDIAPLIRFRSDDLVTFTRARCGCGRTHGRFWLQGRKGDEVVVAGRSILPRDLLGPIEELPETSAGLFQIVRSQREMDVLRLRVGHDPAALKKGADELSGRMQDLLQERFGLPVHVELVTNAELLKLGPPNKIPRVTKP
jgi:phenylacetate-CoA ligase